MCHSLRFEALEGLKRPLKALTSLFPPGATVEKSSTFILEPSSTTWVPLTHTLITHHASALQDVPPPLQCCHDYCKLLNLICCILGQEVSPKL